jgi:hypothetical protein
MNTALFGWLDNSTRWTRIPGKYGLTLPSINCCSLSGARVTGAPLMLVATLGFDFLSSSIPRNSSPPSVFASADTSAEIFAIHLFSGSLSNIRIRVELVQFVQSTHPNQLRSMTISVYRAMVAPRNFRPRRSGQNLLTQETRIDSRLRIRMQAQASVAPRILSPEEAVAEELRRRHAPAAMAGSAYWSSSTSTPKRSPPRQNRTRRAVRSAPRLK